MTRARVLLAPLLLFAMTGCAWYFGEHRAIKVYPRPSKETLVAVNQALRDLHFFPTDIAPTNPNPSLTYVTTAYKEVSLGEIVYIAVRDLGPRQSQVEILIQGDITGAWTWSIWWPPIIFKQIDYRISAAAVPRPTPPPPPPPPSRSQTN